MMRDRYVLAARPRLGTEQRLAIINAFGCLHVAAIKSRGLEPEFARMYARRTRQLIAAFGEPSMKAEMSAATRPLLTTGAALGRAHAKPFHP